MKHYKDPKTNELYAFESDGSQDEFIPKHLVAITDKEADEIRKPSPEQVKKDRVWELKTLLSDTDYKVLPDYDKPDEKVIEQRQAWREEIRKLESE